MKTFAVISGFRPARQKTRTARGVCAAARGGAVFTKTRCLRAAGAMFVRAGV